MKKYLKITLLVAILFIGLFITEKVNAAEAIKSAKVTYGEKTANGVPVTLTFSQDLKDVTLGDGWTISGKTAKKAMKQGSIYMCEVGFADGSKQDAKVAVPIELKVGEILDMSKIGTNPKNFSVEDTTIATVSGTKITATKAGKTTLKGTVGLTPIYAGDISGTQVIQDYDFTWDLTVVADSDKNSDWTDFSKAEYSIVQSNCTEAKIQISNVTPKDSHNYRYLITNTATEPTQDKSSILPLTYYSEGKTFATSNIGSYIALNKDMYLWVYDLYSADSKLVVNGVKIEKPEFPKYANAFTDSCHLVHNSTIITLNFPIGNTDDQNRKINVKVGKISDNKLLQKLYKEDETGFSDLLNYAKTSDSLYNNTITSNFFSGYFTPNESLPNFDSSKLEDDAYYFLYVEIDDENGKYIPAESVTFAQASVYKDTGNWYLFFYGSSDFQWSNMDVGSESDDKKDEQKPNNDNTVSNTIIPATGEKAVIGVIALLLIIAVATHFKLKNKYNGIK